MKRTLIKSIPDSLPSSLLSYFEGARVYDSSSSPEARVYYIEGESGYYLKISAKEALSREAQMTEYFHSKKLCPEVLEYVSDDRDYLLTRRAEGEDLTHEKFLSDPKRLARRLAEELRLLHELDFSDCPVKDRNSSYLSLAFENYEGKRYDLSFTKELFPFKSAEEAISTLKEGMKLMKSDVLLHGDYCLPNVLFDDNFRFSSFIDVGNGGVGDRHIDIFWGAWTLWFNLKTDKYRNYFLDSYGRDLINEDMLRVIAAAEIFG